MQLNLLSVIEHCIVRLATAINTPVPPFDTTTHALPPSASLESSVSVSAVQQGCSAAAALLCCALERQGVESGVFRRMVDVLRGLGMLGGDAVAATVAAAAAAGVSSRRAKALRSRTGAVAETSLALEALSNDISRVVRSPCYILLLHVRLRAHTVCLVCAADSQWQCDR